MKRIPKLVPVMLAGGRGSRLYELTDHMCKPALPMGHNDRMVDWTMENLRRTGAETVLIATQYKSLELSKYLKKIWGNRFANGLAVKQGTRITGKAAGYEGTAHAVRCNMDALRDMGAELVLVVAADHIYNLDLTAMVEAHVESGAPVSAAASVVYKTEACQFGVFEEADDGRILSFAEKPSDPAEIQGRSGHSLVSMGIYLFDMAWLEAAFADPLTDFGHDVLPLAYKQGNAICYRAATLNGAPIYWKDIDTIDAYRETWLALERQPWICPSPSGLPTQSNERLLTHDTIALPGAIVSPHAHIRNAILTGGVRLADHEYIGYDREIDEKWFRITDCGTVVVTPEMLARRTAMRSVRRFRNRSVRQKERPARAAQPSATTVIGSEQQR